MILIHRLTSVVKNPNLNPTTVAAAAATFSTKRSTKTGEEEWNNAWETAWLPDDLSAKSSRAGWESDVSFSLPTPTQKTPTAISSPPEEIDADTQAFVEDMNDNWDQRKGKSVKKGSDRNEGSPESNSNSNSSSSSLYSLENIKRDYRLTKQKIHASLWVQEIEKLEEAKLGSSVSGADDDIEKLLDSASEIFDSANNDLGNPKIPASEFKNKPDGWETTSKNPEGNVWDMSQREEDILVQEFERRIAFNKFQIASFIKTHIFSRRRPIDGWRYMIEVIGPNAKKGKGSVTRVPSVSDESTQPFREEKPHFARTYPSPKGR
ncbi:mucin-like protein [Perilla frutescens var. hirtella]|nr:mucin-like protein [Perilla frutescens var. hirtella]